MDPLTIQAMKNRHTQKPIRVFNKQEDVDRIYGHRPLQRNNYQQDEDDSPPFQVNWGQIDRQIHETVDMQNRVRLNNNDEKMKEEEQKLKLAQKLHQTAMEEMEIERLNIEKLLEEKKKLLNGVVAPSSPSPPLPEKKPIEVEEEQEDVMSCVVCMDAKRAILCDPCNHIALCSNCSKNMTQCPMCMAPATMKRVFLA